MNKIAQTLFIALNGIFLITAGAHAQNAQGTGNTGSGQPLFSEWKEKHARGATPARVPPDRVGSFHFVNRPGERATMLESIVSDWRLLLQNAKDQRTPDPEHEQLQAIEGLALTDYLISQRKRLEPQLTYATVMEKTRRLAFIRTVEWDYKAVLGERQWQAGLPELEQLPELPSDTAAWLRRTTGQPAQTDSGNNFFQRTSTSSGGVDEWTAQFSRQLNQRGIEGSASHRRN